MKDGTKYTQLSIESTIDGWIVKEKGENVRVFTLWWRLHDYIESRLTSKGYEEK